MSSKFCNDCQTEKPLESFTKARANNDFKNSHRIYHAYCKECNARRAREWRKLKGNYRGSGRNRLVPKEDYLLMSAIRQRLVDAKSRCRKYSKDAPSVTDLELYNLFLSQNRACALTGAPLNTIKGHPLCLSLDQKNPKLGYTLDNVQWLSWAVNRAKGDLDMIDFYGMCEAVMTHRKVQRLSKDTPVQAA